MALSLDIAANTRQAQAQVKDLGQALDKTADALDDIARDGSKAGDKLEGSFRDMVRASKRASDDVADGWKDAYRKAERASDDFQRDASGNVQNFKQEAVQNLSEVASSWKGDLEGMADGVQGLTGGLAASLTPGIGIPVAILGAAAAAFFASWQQAAEDSKQRVSDMYADMIESGNTFLSESFIQQAVKTLGEDAGKWADANKRVEETGIGIGDILRAMVGDQEALAAAQKVYVDERDREVAAIEASNRPLEEKTTLIEAANTKYAEQTDWIRQVIADTGTAVDKAQGVADAIRKGNDEMDKLAAKWAGIPKSQQLGITLNTSEFDRQFNELARKASSGIRVVLRPEQGRAWE